MSIELRLGRWQDALEGVTCDLLAVDAPYSAKTHGGHDSAPTVAGQWFGKGTHGNYNSSIAGELYSRSKDAAASAGLNPVVRRAIDYAGWTTDDVRAFVASWSPRTSGWMVSITDHVLAPVWAEAMASHGRYVFAPLPWVASGSRVRLTGDGPSSWTCWIIVGRPTTGTYRDGTPAAKWGTLPGAYVITQDRNIVVGGKPLDLMRAIVRDYSRPGDLVCDPCAGGGTTLLAACLEGRRSIGAEMDQETHAKATARLHPETPLLDWGGVRVEQGRLDLAGGARG